MRTKGLEVAKRKDNTAKLRTLIIVAAGVVVAAIIGAGLFYSGDVGEPYTTLDKPDGRGDVRITAFFSYLCPHCRRLEELAEGWAESLPAGVVFERVHIAFSAETRLLAEAHLALRQHAAANANHERIFRAIQDHNRRFPSPAALADLLDGHGIDRATFLRTVASPRIARQAAADERRFTSLGLTAVPALVVDDKYIVNAALGRKEALDVAADLARDQLAKRGLGAGGDV